MIHHMSTEPLRIVTIGVELRVRTAQLSADWDELAAIRAELGALADRLMADSRGNREVQLLWTVERDTTTPGILMIPEGIASSNPDP